MDYTSETGCGCSALLGMFAGYALMLGLIDTEFSKEWPKLSYLLFWPTVLLVGIGVFLILDSSPWAKAAEEKRCKEWLAEEIHKQDEEERRRKEREAEERRSKEAEERRKKKQIEEERRLYEERFLLYLFSMLAKLAKADGRVDAVEVKTVERAFERFELASRRREYCSFVFNSAKNDSHSIIWYAEQFGKLITDAEVKVFVYELLWDIACADGWLHPMEKNMLRNLCRFLGIRDALYDINYLRRRTSFIEGDKNDAKGKARGPNPKENWRKWNRSYISGKSSIWDAYTILECDQMVTDEELKTAYRRMAKRYHPDLLRANGVPEEMIAVATEQMAQVNAAWEDIRRIRGFT